MGQVGWVIEEDDGTADGMAQLMGWHSFDGTDPVMAQVM